MQKFPPLKNIGVISVLSATLVAGGYGLVQSQQPRADPLQPVAAAEEQQAVTSEVNAVNQIPVSGKPSKPLRTWQQVVKQAPVSPEKAVDESAATGPVELVAVRDLKGKPEITNVTVPSKEAAKVRVQQELSDPQVLDIRPVVPISLAEIPAPTTTTAKTPSALVSPSGMSSENPVSNAPPSSPAVSPIRVSAAEVETTNVSQDPEATQWALSAMQAPQLWAQGGNASGASIAVLDTGVQADHPDLAGVVAAGKNLSPEAQPATVDQHGHGTHVSGIIGAVANNNRGVAGIAQRVKVLPVKVLKSDGTGTDVTVSNGIIWSADQNVAVINMSLGFSSYSAVMEAAIAYAQSKGVLVVASAGNGREGGNLTNYPAAYDGVMSVAATDASNVSAYFSNTGKYVDIAAPGVKIVSTMPLAVSSTGYAALSGTSMATPFVSGVAAVLRAQAPSLSAPQIADILTDTAKDLEAPGWDEATGRGLVQPLAALAEARRQTSSTSEGIWTISAPRRALWRQNVPVYIKASSAKTTLRVCVKSGKANEVCGAYGTNDQGAATVNVVVAGHTTVTASTKGKTSPLVTIQGLPKITLRAQGAVGVTAQIAPNGITVVLQRQQADQTWAEVQKLTVPASGTVKATGLRSGKYRIATPSTSITVAAVSGVIILK